MTLAHRFAAVRGFARYLATIDPRTEIPPAGVFARGSGARPYIYSADEIGGWSRPPGRCVRRCGRRPTKRCSGCLPPRACASGKRSALEGADVDLTTGSSRVRNGKFARARLVPLHPTATEALRAYAARRDRLRPAPKSDRFFLSTVGTALTYTGVHKTFIQVSTATGLRTTPGRPRIHDLRHSLVVNTLIGWQRDGVDVGSRLAVLSTYLGHVNPAGTYWYLTAVPELMQLAAAGLDDGPGSRS